jgi:opacity protein-like surface antigen
MRCEPGVLHFALGAALAAVSSAAFAGHPYVGGAIGVGIGRSNDIDEKVEFPGTTDGDDIRYDDVFALKYHPTIMLDAVAGYDLGLVRIEGELSRKRSKFKRNDDDDITDQFLSELNEGLNRTGTALPPLTIDDFQPRGSLTVDSAMANILLDVGLGHRLTAYGGGGLGRSIADGLHDRDSGFAWQYMAGVRYAVSTRIEFGLKYRYFNSGVVELFDDPIAFVANPGQGPGSAAVTPVFKGKFRSRNMLGTLTYNFR